MNTVSIRDYERPELPLYDRLSSLGRRFPVLNDRQGITPFDPDLIEQWIHDEATSTGAYHAGVLLLNLAGAGAAPTFDVLTAMAVWNDGEKQMFVNLLRVWPFDQ